MNRLLSSSKLIFKAAALNSRQFSKFGRKPVKRVLKSKSENSVQKRAEDAWVSVKDESSGQIYWWNQVTNETTTLGEPKPTGPTAVQSYSGAPAPAVASGGGMMSGIGGTIATGMAFGVGSSIGHHAIGSMFGGGSSSHGGDPGPMSSGDAGDGDDWEV